MGILMRIRKSICAWRAPPVSPVRFDELGFGIASPDAPRIRWEDVRAIRACKADMLTFDEIRVRFNHAQGALAVSEDDPGFADLMREVVRRFPSAAGWHARVSQPPFARCETMLYARSPVAQPAEAAGLAPSAPSGG